MIFVDPHQPVHASSADTTFRYIKLGLLTSRFEPSRGALYLHAMLRNLITGLAVFVALISAALYISERNEHNNFRAHHAKLPTCTSPREAMERFKNASQMHTDKITTHAYHLHYGPFLAPLIHQPVRMLEIGVQDGPSLGLWRRLFPRYEHIFAIGYKGTGGRGTMDVSSFRRELHDRVTLFGGDQSDLSFLGRVEAELGGKQLDLIIDDGSHVPWHQIVTLKRIFGWLADGGIYIIEDIETSYWDGQPPLLYPSLYSYPIAEAGVGRRGNAVEKLKQVADVINRKFLGDPTFSYLEGVDQSVSSRTRSSSPKRSRRSGATAPTSRRRAGRGRILRARVSGTGSALLTNSRKWSAARLRWTPSRVA